MGSKQPVQREEQLPPHSSEAELGVLSCCVQSPVWCMNECEERSVTWEWFYDLRHQCLFEAMRLLQQAGKDWDLLVLFQHLKDHQRLEDAGGLDYVQKLPDAAVGAGQLGEYLYIVREKWVLRRLLKSCTAAVVESYESTEPDELVSRVSDELLVLQEERGVAQEVSMKQLMPEAVARLEDYHRGRAQIEGLTTGIEYLDKLTLGLGGRHGNYIVLSGRPGTGKTSLGLQVAIHAALDYVWWEPVLENGRVVTEKNAEGEDRVKCNRRVGVSVAIFSLEMMDEAVVERMLFQRAEADMQRWRTGFMEKKDQEGLARAATQLNTDRIWIDDEPRCTIDTLKAKARRLKRQRSIGLFVVDYIQLMRNSSRRFRDDRVQEMNEISSELQLLGKELKTPFIVIAQMNRDFEKDPNRTPRLSDLKDCGGIEQDADVVGFLYQPKLKEQQNEQYDRAMTEAFGNDWSKYPQRQDLLLAKQRYGPSGKKVELLFMGNCTKYLDWNVWLKNQGLKEGAKGERKKEQRDLEQVVDEM